MRLRGNSDGKSLICQRYAKAEAEHEFEGQSGPKHLAEPVVCSEREPPGIFEACVAVVAILLACRQSAADD